MKGNQKYSKAEFRADGSSRRIGLSRIRAAKIRSAKKTVNKAARRSFKTNESYE